MVRKILDACALVGLLVSASLAGGSFYLYKYVTSPHFETEVKNKLMGDMNKKLPSSIDKQLPKTTGLGLPM